jgi:hypothetical protein
MESPHQSFNIFTTDGNLIVHNYLVKDLIKIEWCATAIFFNHKKE